MALVSRFGRSRGQSTDSFRILRAHTAGRKVAALHSVELLAGLLNNSFRIVAQSRTVSVPAYSVHIRFYAQIDFEGTFGSLSAILFAIAAASVSTIGGVQLVNLDHHVAVAHADALGAEGVIHIHEHLID